MQKIQANKIWNEYETGQKYLNSFGYYDQIEECWRYYNGDQWNGLITAGDKPPALNILKTIADHKISTVAQNGMTISYSTMNYKDDYLKSVALCGLLNDHAQHKWERLKMDNVVWESVKNACVSGDEFTYFFQDKKGLNYRHIDNANILLADEQEEDIQKQKYILIIQRLFVDDIKKIAKKNKLKQEDIDAIVSDTDTTYQMGDKAKKEVSENNPDGKCISILKMWKDEEGIVKWCRSTKDVVYEPVDDTLPKLKLYPIAHFSWDSEKGSARGISEIYHRIPNQVEINKTIARAFASTKQTAYPHIVYNENAIDAEQISKLTTVGSIIPLSSNTPISNIKDVIGYMETTQMQPVVIQLLELLQNETRELAGASEIATGNINPEKASGASIIAQRDSNAKPLNFQVSSLKQYIEDYGLISMDMDMAYNPDGLEIIVDDVNEEGNPIKRIEKIPIKDIEKLKYEVKIDVSPTDPYTKYSENTTLENMLAAGMLQLDEFEEMSDVNSPTPKQKLRQVLDKRRESGMALPSEIAKLQQELMIAQTTLQIAQLKQQLEMLQGNVVPMQAVEEMQTQMQDAHTEQLKQVVEDKLSKKAGEKINGGQKENVKVNSES